MDGNQNPPSVESPAGVHTLDFLNDENKLVIIFLLYSFGSLNLKMLAFLLNKSEPPVLRWLKIMLKEELIELDLSETKSARGKFYRITPKVEKFFEVESFPIPNQKNLTDSQKNQILNQGLNLLRSLGNIAQILGNMTATFFDAQKQEILSELPPEDMLASSSYSVFHLKSIEEVHEFGTMVKEFNDQLEQRFGGANVKVPVPYTYALYYNLCPLYRIKELLDHMKKEW